MHWLEEIEFIITIILILILILCKYQRQVKDICRQLLFLKVSLVLLRQNFN